MPVIRSLRCQHHGDTGAAGAGGCPDTGAGSAGNASGAYAGAQTQLLFGARKRRQQQQFAPHWVPVSSGQQQRPSGHCIGLFSTHTCRAVELGFMRSVVCTSVRPRARPQG